MSKYHEQKRLELNAKIAEKETLICDLQAQIEAAKREIIKLNYEEKELYFDQYYGKED